MIHKHALTPLELAYAGVEEIYIFIPNLDGGGAERMMVNLANGIHKRGIRVSFIVVEAKGPYISDVNPNIEIIDLMRSGVLDALLPLYKFLRRKKPDVLLVTLNHASIVALIAKKLAMVKTRVIVREANTLSRHVGKTFRGKLIKLFVKKLYRYADAIVAVSDGCANDLSRVTGISRDAITVLPNPVVTHDIETKAREQVAHPWLTNGAKIPVILAVGRLNEQKDYPTLIRAFKKVVEVQDSRLIILGEGQKREELTDLISDLGLNDKISMPGFVSNPFAYMARASLFVLSSKYEGLPGVLIQAMACGCPVVSTDCPSGPREILEDGKYGPLVPVGDVEALAAAIIDVLASRPFRDHSALKQRASMYSVESATQSYLRVIVNNRQESIFQMTD